MRKAFSVWIIIFANVGGALFELSTRGAHLRTLALWPLGAGFQPWQPVTYAFVHASPVHLAVSLFGIWMFGREVEMVAGRLRLLYLYIAGVLSAALAQLLVTAATGSVYPAMGASGGVFGLLLAYAVFFWQRTIVLKFPRAAFPAWLFVLVYAGVELALGVVGSAAGIGHFAYLGGMIGGYLVVRRWHKRMPGGG